MKPATLGEQRCADRIGRLGWIDGFIDEMRPYLFVRERDRLLIVVPNQSYKLNETGVDLMGRLLKGARIGEILPGIRRDPEKESQVDAFFRAVAAFVSELFCERGKDWTAGTETVPFTRPHNLLPVLSEIALTYRCNLNCVFCYAGCSCLKSDSRTEMSTAETTRVLERIRHEAQVPSVSFTGGEPTLRNDLPELVGRAAGLGLRVNLITNGTNITRDMARRLREAGLASAQVSLEGPTQQVHEEMTRVPGSFSRTLRGLEALREAGVTVHPHSTLTTINSPYVEAYVSFIASLGLPRLSMNQLIPVGTGGEHPDIWLSYTDIGGFIETARKTARRKNVEFMWYSPTPLCLYNPIGAGLGNKSCAACDGLVSVNPEGFVLPCSSLDEKVGNLLTEPFDRIWRGPRARWWMEKRYAPASCQACEEFTVCAAACPLYWKRVGYGEISGPGGIA